MTTTVAPTEAVPAVPAVRRKRPLWKLAIRPNHVANKYLSLMIYGGYVVLLILGWLVLPAIIPSPLRVFNALMVLITEVGLAGELWASLTLSLNAILVATFISLLIAYASVIPIFRPLGVMLSKGRFLSLVGLSFLFTLYIGGGYPLKLSLLTFGLTVFMVTSLLDVVHGVTDADLDYARSMRYSEWGVLYEMRILGTGAAVFDVIIQNAAMGWLMLTMVEGTVRGGGGIGRMLLDEDKHFNLPAVFAVQLVFLLVGVGQDLLLRWIKGMVVPSARLAFNKGK